MEAIGRPWPGCGVAGLHWGYPIEPPSGELAGATTAPHRVHTMPFSSGHHSLRAQSGDVRATGAYLRSARPESHVSRTASTWQLRLFMARPNVDAPCCIHCERHRVSAAQRVPAARLAAARRGKAREGVGGRGGRGARGVNSPPGGRRATPRHASPGKATPCACTATLPTVIAKCMLCWLLENYASTTCIPCLE